MRPIMTVKTNVTKIFQNLKAENIPCQSPEGISPLAANEIRYPVPQGFALIGALRTHNITQRRIPV